MFYQEYNNWIKGCSHTCFEEIRFSDLQQDQSSMFYCIDLLKKLSFRYYTSIHCLTGLEGPNSVSLTSSQIHSQQQRLPENQSVKPGGSRRDVRHGGEVWEDACCCQLGWG